MNLGPNNKWDAVDRLSQKFFHLKGPYPIICPGASDNTGAGNPPRNRNIHQENQSDSFSPWIQAHFLGFRLTRACLGLASVSLTVHQPSSFLPNRP